MEKKTAFQEMLSETIDRFDKQNDLEDRSPFVSDVLDKQLHWNVDKLGVSTDLTNMKSVTSECLGNSGEFNLINNKGSSFSTTDMNIPDRFKHITKRIDEISIENIIRLRFKNRL